MNQIKCYGTIKDKSNWSLFYAVYVKWTAVDQIKM